MVVQVNALSVAAMLILVFNSGTTHAQQGRSARTTGSAMELFTVPEVAKRMELTDSQVELAKKLAAEFREAVAEEMKGAAGGTAQERRANRGKLLEKLESLRKAGEEKLGESLGPEKMKRAEQLRLQALGLMYIITSPSMATKMDIDRAKAFESLSGLREEFRSAGNQQVDRQSAVEKANEMLAEGLSDEQKDRWKEMIGEPADKDLLSAIRAGLFRERQGRTE